jgi:Icc-related predicted phosphoesterase
MISPETGHFMHPEFQPVLEQLPSKAEDPYVNFAKIRKVIINAADMYSTHPLVVAKELQLSRVDHVLEAKEIENARTSRYAYVGDIHGLTDPDFTKLRETLTAGEFTQVFFLGDIGGSEKLSKLQRLFYQGGPELSDNQFYNKYNSMMKEPGANQEEAIDAVRPGYLNLRAYEIFLESIGSLSEEEAREHAQEEMWALPQEEIKQRILKALSHKHYGHYVSDLPVEAIISLQADVESYYERFMTMTREIKAKGIDVLVLQGNWDARLPFDFERNTDLPIPLSQDKRRFNPSVFFKRKIPYFTQLGVVNSRDAVHIMVPFDTVAGDISSTIGIYRLREIRTQIIEAKKSGKRVVMLAHAVPAWERHTNKLPTGEGKVTQDGLQNLIKFLKPHDVVYGHEHQKRSVEVESIYKIRFADEIEIGPEETLKELSVSNSGILAVPLPVPGQLEYGLATLELSRYGKGNPRGNGGIQSPVRVDRPIVAHEKVSETLPTEASLYPQGKKNGQANYRIK